MLESKKRPTSSRPGSVQIRRQESRRGAKKKKKKTKIGWGTVRMEAAYTERERDHRLESGKRKEKKCAALILLADEMMTAEE